jgi:protein SCO1/2
MNDNQNPSRKLTRIVIILSAVIAILSLYILLTIDLPNKPLAGQGGIAADENVQIGGDFVLTDQNGNEFNSKMMKGRMSLVYFGFTYCPDICPTSLQKLSNVLSTLEKYQIDVLPIFITVDPKRDTPALLKEYLGHFHPKFIGLTGDEDIIKKVADLYKVFYAKVDTQGQEENKYMIDHSSFVYLMDKNGKYMKHFYMSSTPEEIIEYIRVNK